MTAVITIELNEETGRACVIRHGSANTYQYHGCRCDLCREGNRLRVAKYRDRKRQENEESRHEGGSQQIATS